MVLGSTGSTGSESSILGSVDGVSENLIGEDGVVGDDGSSQMVRDPLKNVEDLLLIAVTPFSDDLEGSEQFGKKEFSLPVTSEVFERHEDSGGFESSVLLRDGVVLEGNTSPEDFGAIKLKDGVHMILNFLGRPGEDGPDSKVLERSLGGLSLHLLEEIGLPPVAVHKHDRLGGTLLSRVTIGILIALPGNIVDLFLRLGRVRSEDFPIVTSIFKSNFAVKGFHEVLTDLGGPGEEGHLGVGFLEDGFHDGSIGVKEVHIFLG